MKCEPIERLVVDTPQASAGAVIEKIGRRRGTLEHMSGQDRVRLEFLVPSRGLFGYRSEFMTDTRGEGIMSAVFERYEPVKGDIPHRSVGALVAHESGVSTPYALFYAQERGTLFIGAQQNVYEGMIVGQNSRPDDLVVNVCKQKHVTNMRNASASEDAMRLISVHPMTLEECLEFIDDDELLEITPKTLRMRKRILNAGDRARSGGISRTNGVFCVCVLSIWNPPAGLIEGLRGIFLRAPPGARKNSTERNVSPDAVWPRPSGATMCKQ